MTLRSLIVASLFTVGGLSACVAGPFARTVMRESRAEVNKELRRPSRPFCFVGSAMDGTVVTRVSDSAIRQGLRAGDRIRSINGDSVSGYLEYRRAMEGLTVGKSAMLEVIRDDEVIAISVNCGDSKPFQRAYLRAMAAAETGDWQGCIAAATEIESISVPSAWIASLRYRCAQAEHDGLLQRLGVPPSTIAVSELHSSLLRGLQEARYSPRIVSKNREFFAEGIRFLDDYGFSDEARSLSTLYRSIRRANEAVPSESSRANPSDAPLRQKSSGTCFAVRPDGWLVTAFHVTEGAQKIEVEYQGHQLGARLEGVSRSNDVAVLRIDHATPDFLTLRPKVPVTLDYNVFTVGFPAPDILGWDVKLDSGTITGLSGLGDRSLYQISVPVQPGNSGGPLVDDHGRVVGVVVAQANALAFLKMTGSLPQSINFAVKAEIVATLVGELERQPDAPTKQEARKRAERAVCKVFNLQ